MDYKNFLVSKTNSIQCNKLVACSANELRDLRDCKVVIGVAEAAKGGNRRMKALDYYYMPNAMAYNNEAKTITRRGNNLISNGRVLVDIDIHDESVWKPIIEQKVFGKEEELGVEHVEKSLSGGLHMVVRIINGYTAKETLMLWQNYLRLEVDPHTHDVARACYLVPNYLVLYESESFKDGYSKPIDSEENETIRDMITDAFWRELLFEDNYITVDCDNEAIPELSGKALIDATPIAHSATAFHSTFTAYSFPEYRSTYIDNRDEMKHLIENVIEKYDIQATQREPEWFKVGIAIHNVLGDEGEEWYHRVSSHYRNYSYAETHSKWQHILNNSYDKADMGFFVANLLNCMTDAQKAEAFGR